MKLVIFLVIGFFIGQNAMEAKDSFESKAFKYMAIDLAYVVLGVVAFFVTLGLK